LIVTGLYGDNDAGVGVQSGSRYAGSFGDGNRTRARIGILEQSHEAGLIRLLSNVPVIPEGAPEIK
jgi:hypothetical protein